MKVPDELHSLYREGLVIPFVGAGVSISVEWGKPGAVRRGISWTEMVDRAIRGLDVDPPELLRARGTDLQILEYFKLRNEGVARLTNWLHAEMQAPDDAVSSSPILRELAAMTRCDVYYTTNYDEFVERALRLSGRTPHVVATEAQMSRARPGEPQVVKFHGDFNHPSYMVVTESDYEKRLAFKTPLDFRLRSDVLGRVVLFVGYSFRDPNVAYLFSLINEYFEALPTSPTGRRAYIVVADPSDFEKRLFRARNIDVIPVSGSNMAEDTAAFLRELRAGS